MTTKREKNTEWARQHRLKAWAAKAAAATTCPAMLARGRACKAPLTSRFVDGQTVPFCAQCDRKRRGVCLDCHTEPVYGRVGTALRCTLCKKLAKQLQCNVSKARYRTTRNAKARQYARDHSQERREYKRLLRKLKPQRTAQLKRESYLRNREKALAYHAAYRAERAAQRREWERLRNAGELPPRTCLTCDTVLTGRPKRCAPCKDADRRNARAILSTRLERVA